jgi:hypothetical protein
MILWANWNSIKHNGITMATLCIHTIANVQAGTEKEWMSKWAGESDSEREKKVYCIQLR